MEKEMSVDTRKSRETRYKKHAEIFIFTNTQNTLSIDQYKSVPLIF